jgi:hypothetical protein
MIFAAPAFLAAQQDQDQASVAEAARKAQAEKKNAPKAKISIDNDNLGTLTGTINVVGAAPAATPEKTTTAAAPGEKPQPKKDEAYFRDKFAVANKKLAEDSHELDIMQREYNLKQQQYYGGDPMAALKQDYTRQDLNDSKAKIDDKKAVVDQDKADIASLEDELRQAGGDPGWESQPPQAGPAQSGAAQPAQGGSGNGQQSTAPTSAQASQP